MQVVVGGMGVGGKGHVEPAATTVKPAPAMLLPMVDKGCDWLFVIVIGKRVWTPIGILPNASEVGEIVTGCAMPVPLSVMLCGLVAALSVIVNVPGAAPVAVGLKTIA